MMLFKVWQKKTKKFIEPTGYYIGSDGRLYVKTFDSFSIVPEPVAVPVFCSKVPDANGDLLYHGDVIDLRQDENPGEHNIKVVVFEDGAFRLWSWNFANKNLTFPVLCKSWVSRLGHVRIGNIFENPELKR